MNARTEMPDIQLSIVTNNSVQWPPKRNGKKITPGFSRLNDLQFLYLEQLYGVATMHSENLFVFSNGYYTS